MIYPATYDITILQNATWRGSFRVTQNGQEITEITITANTPTFSSSCHGLSVGRKVVFTGGSKIPCGLEVNKIYFVISAGLTTSQFQVSATSGGPSINVSGSPEGVFYVAEPVDLTGYVIDSDIHIIGGTEIATFIPVATAPTDGEFELTLAPATTALLSPGNYGYDVSLTSTGGERYYWLTGTATVKATYSRN